MTSTSFRPRTGEPPPRDRPPRRPGTEFEARWRDPERTLADYLSALWARKLWVLGACAVTSAIAFFYALTLPNVYVSQASLLVRGSTGGASAAEVAANMLRMGNIGPSQVLSALEVVNSKMVADRVVEQLGPAEITKPYQPDRSQVEQEKMGLADRVIDWMHRMQASFFAGTQTAETQRPEFAAEVFRRNFIAWADERASLIRVLYRASDRAQAQRILQEAVAMAVQRYRQVSAPSESREFVEQNLTLVRETYDRAKADYDAFVRTHGRMRFNDEIEARERAFAAMEATLDLRRREQGSTKQTIDKFEAQLSRMADRRERRVKVTADDGQTRPLLIQRRVEFETKLLQIQSQYQNRPERYEADFEWQLARDQLAGIERAIREATEPYEVVQWEDNPEFLAIDGRLRQKRLDLIELEESLPKLETDVETERKELGALHALQEDADRIAEAFSRAKADLLKMEDLRQTWEYQTQLAALGIDDLKVVEEPTFPLLKEGPNRSRIILAGIAAGLFLSLTVILLMVRLSRTFLRTSEVAVSLGRSDVVGLPWLERGNVRRFRVARRKGWD